jgi:hypothetical protein
MEFQLLAINPYHDEGQDQQPRKRADMMALTGCGITPNPELNFARVIMDLPHVSSIQG